MRILSIMMSFVVLLLFAGCAHVPHVPTEQLLAEAKKCVDQAAIENSLQSEMGIVVEATQEQHDACWLVINDRIESERKRELKERQPCPRGTTEWCGGGFGRGNCECRTITSVSTGNVMW